MLLRPVLTNGRLMPESGSIRTPAAQIQTACSGQQRRQAEGQQPPLVIPPRRGQWRSRAR